MKLLGGRQRSAWSEKGVWRGVQMVRAAPVRVRSGVTQLGGRQLVGAQQRRQQQLAREIRSQQAVGRAALAAEEVGVGAQPQQEVLQRVGACIRHCLLGAVRRGCAHRRGRRGLAATQEEVESARGYRGDAAEDQEVGEAPGVDGALCCCESHDTHRLWLTRPCESHDGADNIFARYPDLHRLPSRSRLVCLVAQLHLHPGAAHDALHPAHHFVQQLSTCLPVLQICARSLPGLLQRVPDGRVERAKALDVLRKRGCRERPALLPCRRLNVAVLLGSPGGRHCLGLLQRAVQLAAQRLQLSDFASGRLCQLRHGRVYVGLIARKGDGLHQLLRAAAYLRHLLLRRLHQRQQLLYGLLHLRRAGRARRLTDTSACTRRGECGVREP
mmetsp:Transcript_41213/g.104444  ORF Transcript_41213/g.104444 Transcript_41213/m.104444 type:complete len:385 (+) Transcript_41213:57-1211(+)